MIDDPYFEQSSSDPCEVHQHDSRVDPGDPIEGVACEAAVPANLGDLMLWGHSSKLGGVEGLEETPHIIHGPEEQHICIHVEQRVHVLQDHLLSRQSCVSYNQNTKFFPIPVTDLYTYSMCHLKTDNGLREEQSQSNLFLMRIKYHLAPAKYVVCRESSANQSNSSHGLLTTFYNGVMQCVRR